jgi:predicted nucleotide-binding protein (sugar kinase/HSP70/actin superfamily)
MVVLAKASLRIGVPRSILHFEFGGAVERFLQTLGVEVLVSPHTNREIFSAGKRLVIDELCFPIKVFVGHVAHLAAQNVNRIVIPVIVGHENDRMFPCHPRSRLADIVCALGVCSRDRLLTPAFRFDCAGLTEDGFLELGRMLGFPEAASASALTQARRQASPEGCEQRPGGPTIGVVGRPYVVEDAWMTNQLVERLTSLGCRIMTEGADARIDYAPDGTGLHFALAARTVTLARTFDADPSVDGILFLLPFNCGPDGDIARHLNLTIDTPMLTLVLDELQSSAGLVTRLEAFVDLVSRETVRVGGASR